MAEKPKPPPKSPPPVKKRRARTDLCIHRRKPEEYCSRCDG